MADITESDEFPVQWDDPADAERTWTYDPMHSPRVIPPLGHELHTGPLMTGFAKGWTEAGNPTAAHCRLFNYYSFTARSAPPPLPGSAPSTPDALLEWTAGGGSRWRDEILPEVKRQIEHYRTTDFASLSNAQLADELTELRAVRVEQGRLHMLAMTPWDLATNMLVDAYVQMTGGTELDAVRLLQGCGNMSVVAGRALWELSKLASAIPAVRKRLLEMANESASTVLPDLEGDGAAGEFLSGLSDYLDAFGWRIDLQGFAFPTWAEDPTITLRQLKSYIALDGYDPDAELRRLTDERDAAEAELRDRLPADDWSHLSKILDIARDVAPILEDHNFYIDQRLTTLPRRLVLESGRRLAADSIIDDPADVFFLHLNELTEALESAPSDHRTLTAARRQEMERWSKVTPPLFLGAPPPPPTDGPRDAARIRFAGDRRLGSDQPNMLVSHGGSAGVAVGPARILPTLGDAGRLNKGDVLVTGTTMPPWTPLFAVASSIVVETGGILSHAAVTAREYGIPAVLGVVDATHSIRDGQMLEVDGTQGTVRILS